MNELLINIYVMIVPAFEWILPVLKRLSLFAMIEDVDAVKY